MSKNEKPLLKLTEQEKLFLDYCANPKIIEESPEKAEQIAKAVVANIGNMKLNKKLNNKAFKSGYHVMVVNEARYFLFKTRKIESSFIALNKLDVVLQSEEQGKPVKEFEKLSLPEFGHIQNIKDIQDPWAARLNDLAKIVKNPEIKEVVSNINRVKELDEKLQEGVNKNAMGLRSGDIAMYKTDKKWSIKGNKGSWLGHEGRLEEAFLSEYNHAAPIFISTDKNNKKSALASDVWSEAEIHKIPVGELAQSDVYRLDVTKLVSSERVAQLEKIDYGYRENSEGGKVKITWQEAMQERFEQLTEAFHKGQDHYVVQELEKKIEELHEKRKKIEETKVLDPLDDKFDKVADVEHQEISKELTKIRKQASILRFNKISNDSSRIGDVGFWVGPKALTEGHKQVFDKNDVRSISEKMFNATTDEKKMLCSEYAVKSQLSVIDQLNKLTSYDLMAAGFINKEETVVKNPVPDNERLDRVHPGRLVEILKSSGALSKVETNISKFIRTEDLKVNSVSKDFVKPLNEKIYSVLKDSKDLEEFKKNAIDATDQYLKSYKVDEATRNNVKEKVAGPEFSQIYEQYQKKPEGIKEKIKGACIKILEFCKIIKKDKEVRQDIDKVINSAKEIGQNLKMKMSVISQSKTGPIRKIENKGRSSGYIG